MSEFIDDEITADDMRSGSDCEIEFDDDSEGPPAAAFHAFRFMRVIHAITSSLDALIMVCTCELFAAS